MGKLRIGTMLTVLNASHLCYMVKGDFQERGGIMLVGPPGTLKSTILKASFRDYPDKSYHTDLTTRELIRMRDKITSGGIHTMVFEEFAKIYARTNPTAAENIEKHIQALVEQGFTRASYEPQDIFTEEVKCFVVGGLVRVQYEKRLLGWQDDGFARRFLWCHIVMDNVQALIDAVEKWQKIPIDVELRFTSPADGTIKYDVTPDEARKIRQWCSNQEGQAESAKILHKILSVLKWRYRNRTEEKKVPFQLLDEFAVCIGKEGKTPARLVI